MTPKEQSVNSVQNVPINTKNTQGRKAGAILFPRNSLTDALRVAKSIWNDNAGRPFPIGDLASQLNYSPTSGNFRDLIRSASRYGIIEGSWVQDTTKTIGLSSLGLSIVAPKVGEDPNSYILKALQTPEVFRDFLNSINGRVIPPTDVCKSTLIREHHIIKSDVDACYAVLMKNIQEFNLTLDNTQGKQYLRLDKLSTNIPASHEPNETTDLETPINNDSLQTFSQSEEIPQERPTKSIPRVFITHSKNKKILDQLKDMLKFGEFEFRIAEEKETTAIPIPDKVFGLMRECNCAIINISADDEMKQQDDSYRINENVLIEIGGAFIHYDKRVILLVDKRLTLPSNLQGLYRCEYEGDELSWTVAMKLQKALAGFKEKI